MKHCKWLALVLVFGMGAIIVDPVTVVQFANPVGVAQAMDRDPAAVVAILLANITQKEADAIEAALFPTPSDAKLRADLVAWRDIGLKLGRPIDDPEVVALKVRIDAIPIVGDIEIEPMK